MMALKRAKPRPHPGRQQMPKAYKLQRAPPASPRGSSPQAESQALRAPRQLSSHHQEAMVGAGSSRTQAQAQAQAGNEVSVQRQNGTGPGIWRKEQMGKTPNRRKA